MIQDNQTTKNLHYFNEVNKSIIYLERILHTHTTPTTTTTTTNFFPSS